MISRVIILGGGSAGFLAALALKRKLPNLDVQVIRSKDIGIIGVGEGSTPGLTRFLHEYIKVSTKKLHQIADPVWKLGLRFIWGRRPYFNYNFNQGQVMGRVAGLRKMKAAYCAGEMEFEDPISALMTMDRVFERGPRNEPVLHSNLAYHVENDKFVYFLEDMAAALGVRILSDTVTHVEQNESGIAALQLASGRRETAELFVDASGFISFLLGKTLQEPFISYAKTLFCDRAVVGGWDRSAPEDQVIKPYTTCETMNCGWCWRIDHENRINRGYVYSSAFISDAEAEAEFRQKNPKVGPSRIVRFVAGRYRNLWVKNVVAVGNAAGFVEPLEATSLGVIAHESRTLTDTLIESELNPGPADVRSFNSLHARYWDDIRDFLSIHYRFNERLDTPFWRHCRAETELCGAEKIVELYREVGPSMWLEQAIDPISQFAAAGYLALLTGQQVPHAREHVPADYEMRAWDAERLRYRQMAARAFSAREALEIIRSPKWEWPTTPTKVYL